MRINWSNVFVWLGMVPMIVGSGWALFAYLAVGVTQNV